MSDLVRGQSTTDNGRTCAGCGTLLAPPTNGRGWRKWCSEKCRKASYGDPCIDCGGRTIYGAEHARVPEPRCDACNRQRGSDRRCERAMAMLTLRRQGMSNIAIAAELDFPAHSVNSELHRLRSLGFSMPKVPGRGRPARVGAVVTAEAAVLGRELAERGFTPETERRAA